MSRPTIRVCRRSGCPNLRPCPTEGHEPRAWEGSTRRRTLPPDWNRRRQRILRRDPACTLQLPDVCTILSTEVDHIDDPDDHELTNLRGVCSPCHTERTKQQSANARRRARG